MWRVNIMTSVCIARIQPCFCDSNHALSTIGAATADSSNSIGRLITLGMMQNTVLLVWRSSESNAKAEAIPLHLGWFASVSQPCDSLLPVSAVPQVSTYLRTLALIK